MRFSVTAFLSAIVIAFAASSTASAGPIAISTPTGLNPGNHFRIMFVTTGDSPAIFGSSGIYDNFVTTDAGGATYNGSAITWKAIVSTTSISAISHIGVTGDAVYLPDGTLVATSDGTGVGGLWSGTLQNAPNQYLNGSAPIAGTRVNTGTQVNGASFGALALGNAQVVYGLSNQHTSLWTQANFNTNATSNHYYGISNELTVPAVSTVPEPSSAILLGIGGLAGLVYSRTRKRK
jgi:hypothetical protein